jgi:folate-dependent phosphoribosylglycinamide formyltransferase PurN
LVRAPITILGRDGPSSRILFNVLRREFGSTLAVLEPPASRFRMLLRRQQRYGASRVAGQVLFRLFIVTWREATSRRRRAEIMTETELDESPIPSDARVRVPSANSVETIRLLQSYAPPVVVVSGSRILSADVLHCVQSPFLNIHAGITPLYRGVHGAYWALVQRDREHCGVTLHLVDEGIDTGPIVGQTLIDPTARDNFATYPLLQIANAVPLLVQAIASVFDGQELRCASPPLGRSAYWTHPTLASYLRAGVP